VAWAGRESARHPGLLRLGLFGSYARGDAGVGSDIDLVAVVAEADQPFASRPLAWDLLALPLPAEILVYTHAEWDRLQSEGGRFARTVAEEARWLWEAPGSREELGAAGPLR
jgi:uncharacterized protein